MKIGIDARMYGPMVGGGGLGRYVEQLVTHLQNIDHENRYVLFLKKENFDACRITNPNFEKKLADIHWYTWKEQLLLGRLIDAEHLDLVHFPHWNVPMSLRTRFVVTIHDLILIEEPKSAKATTRNPLIYHIKYKLFEQVLAHALIASRRIIAVSKYTKSSILKHFPKILEDKIRVVYGGITALPSLPSSFAGQAGPTFGPENPSAPFSSLQLPSTYLLYIGNAYPHKNLDTLLDAFAIINQSQPDLHLVLAGRNDVFYERLRQRVKNTQELKPFVHFISNPSDANIAALYHRATLFVFPSRTEGFGLPPLEAMQAGLPVAASRAASIPEVLGNAASYFSPTDPSEMAHVIEQVIKDKTKQQTIIAEGYIQIKKYSWNKTAQETIAMYAKAKIN